MLIRKTVYSMTLHVFNNQYLIISLLWYKFASNRLKMNYFTNMIKMYTRNGRGLFNCLIY